MALEKEIAYLRAHRDELLRQYVPSLNLHVHNAF